MPEESEARNRMNNPKKRSREVVQYKTFEEVLRKIHPFGVYQIFACVCIIFAQIEWAGNFNFVNIIGSAEPDWACTLKNNTTVTINATDPNKCELMKNCVNYEAIKNSTDFNSIVASFKMVCGNQDKEEYIQISQAIAMLIGSILGGHLGDTFGRQFLFYFCQLGILITSCLTIASTSWIGYSICQFLNGMFYGIIEVESLTLMMEYTSNQISNDTQCVFPMEYCQYGHCLDCLSNARLAEVLRVSKFGLFADYYGIHVIPRKSSMARGKRENQQSLQRTERHS
jgi:hypothetical protein